MRVYFTRKHGLGTFLRVIVSMRTITLWIYFPYLISPWAINGYGAQRNFSVHHIPESKFPKKRFTELRFSELRFPELHFPEITFPRVTFTQFSFPRVMFPRILFPQVNNSTPLMKSITGRFNGTPKMRLH
jgi:hypothetical protein